MTNLTQSTGKILPMLAVAGGLLLAGCSDNDHSDSTPPPTPELDKMFTITVTNLTANQPMSPIALLAIDKDYYPWQTGEMASHALEKLAESGDSSGFVAQAGTIASLTTGEGILAPGASETLTVTLAQDATSVAVLTMLVNTNDAFSGLNHLDLDAMNIGDTQQKLAAVYDAGTEANSELKGTIPGPADGGEGFNADRDDVNRVHLHPGVISHDDGLMDSVLNASHRFDNPTLRITLKRTR
ncbi:spondin domain-containing protein [Shewanella mesophila]|nr:spondin domain-containing protein [Shewanella mesophila]QYJ87916.1 spondin domain-containing protein [Shewanella mesophila]